MTFTRGSALVGGGALLVAWFAVAGSAPDQDVAPPREAGHAAATSGPGSLAAEVEQQGERLRERMARAPVPHVQPRNPFSFAAVPAPRAIPAARLGTVRAADVAEVADVAPPPLVLMGIAEPPAADGPRRTAVIGGPGSDIFIVAVGEIVAGRYKVKAIGADAIELEDVTTGGFRRLALR